MSITKQGIMGEKIARDFLRREGYKIFQADWIGKRDNGWIIFEVKCKSERFQPPPLEGHGLNKYQIKTRLEYQADTGIRTFLLIIEPEMILGQWLDKLEQTKYFDTDNNIRIYNISEFVILQHKKRDKL
jgi:hypothetical protein